MRLFNMVATTTVALMITFAPVLASAQPPATPATPAAASRWPILVFADPMSSGLSAARPFPRTAAAAWTSIGSPSEVQVPCASR